MPYRYGIKNAFKPSQLAPKSYGWSPGANYSSADVPSQWIASNTGLSDDLLKQQFAYEWFQSGATGVGFPGTDGGFSNPPFVSGAAGRLHPALTDQQGKPARILRGYIRRAEYDVKDDMSKSRLYFMFNPETITRDYVSYLEQSALDPFNTVYQSANTIAPPSIMNFSFELFFDRQEEAADARHPGVFVDYQFFDMVVRNVHPDPATLVSGAIPDSGVMMVNPRDITVIFSPQLSVQGRPTNAQVTFEKFTHRMTPVRMRIRLTILASYFGPPKDMVEYKAEEMPSADSVPIDQIEGMTYDYNFNDVDDASRGLNDLVSYGDQVGQANDANHKIRMDAMNWAKTNKIGTGAAMITAAYNGIGQGQTMGWTSNPGASKIVSEVKRETSVFCPLDSFDWKKELLSGDILISSGGDAAFFVEYSGENLVFMSNPATGSVTKNSGGFDPYTHLLRPTPVGSWGSAARAPGYNPTPTSGTPPAGVLYLNQTTEIATGLVTPDAPSGKIRLSPAAALAFSNWKTAFGSGIPCTSGWRDPDVQQALYEAWEKANHNWKRYAPAASSYHCKGAAVDVDNVWLSAQSPAVQTALRVAARNTGWGQYAWRRQEGPVAKYECPCNWTKGSSDKEPWHFSYGGCG